MQWENYLRGRTLAQAKKKCSNFNIVLLLRYFFNRGIFPSKKFCGTQWKTWHFGVQSSVISQRFFNFNAAHLQLRRVVKWPWIQSTSKWPKDQLICCWLHVLSHVVNHKKQTLHLHAWSKKSSNNIWYICL